MRDIEGKILIPGFYDDVRPLTAIEKRALAQAPAVEEQLKQELAIAAPEGGGAPLAEQILKPALNVHGIQAGHVGVQAANVIGTEAEASVDFRLVPNQTPDKVRERVERHIERQGFFILVSVKPRTSGRGYKRLGSHVTGDSFAAQCTLSRC